LRGSYRRPENRKKKAGVLESGTVQASGVQSQGQLATRESLMRDSHEGKVKHLKVIERVYDPRRLRTAWQQVKQNAGAAGIDQMTVAAFERRKDELLAVIHEKLKAGNYRFKPA
jgi:hypothetical protein